MSSIGIEFVLKAATAGFTKGVASANSSIKDLKRNLREGDVGGGIKRLLGAGAIIEGFRLVINGAQETRKSLEEMGQAIPDNIRSVAALGDGIDALKKQALEVGTSFVASFTRVGETLGGIINTVRSGFGANLVDDKLAESIQRSADKVVAASKTKIAAIMAQNSPEALAADEAKLAAQERKNYENKLSAEQKLLALIEDRDAIEKRIAGMDPNTKNQHLINLANQELQAKNEEIANARKDYDNKSDSLYKDKLSAEDARDALNKKIKDSKQDQYLPSLHDLAGSSEFGYKHIDPKKIAQAKEVERLDMLAQQQGFSGNLDLSSKTQDQADKLRQGLSGFVKSGDADKGADVAKAVDESNAKLESIDRSIKSLTRVN